MEGAMETALEAARRHWEQLLGGEPRLVASAAGLAALAGLWLDRSLPPLSSSQPTDPPLTPLSGNGAAGGAASTCPKASPGPARAAASKTPRFFADEIVHCEIKFAWTGRNTGVHFHHHGGRQADGRARGPERPEPLR